MGEERWPLKQNLEKIVSEVAFVYGTCVNKFSKKVDKKCAAFPLQHMPEVDRNNTLTTLDLCKRGCSAGRTKNIYIQKPSIIFSYAVFIQH